MSERLHVAFIDDDVRLLDGLRRMMRRRRHEWDMAFFPNSVEFVESLSDRRFDVVVSDMRMPDLNGVTVLRQVQRLNPRAARLVLTGQTQARSWLDLLGPGQVVLSKPCPGEELESAIERTLVLRSQSDKEPPASGVLGLPPAWEELLTCLERESAAADLEAVALAPSSAGERLLALLGCEESRDPQALREKLAEATVPLILGAHALVHVSRERGDGIGDLFGRGLRVASRAQEIAIHEHAQGALVQQTVLAAFLHVLVEMNLGSESDLDWSAEEEGRLRADKARRQLRAWGLPDAISEAVAHHRSPSTSLLRGKSPMPYVHAAWVFERSDQQPESAELDRSYLTRLGVCAKVDCWRELRSPWRSYVSQKRGS